MLMIVGIENQIDWFKQRNPRTIPFGGFSFLTS
jgi:hypothetical protein